LDLFYVAPLASRSYSPAKKTMRVRFGQLPV